jgi:hypothetical protein
MTTIDQYWERVEDALDDARLIAWDTCHKIYIALDDAEADWFRASDYTVVDHVDHADLLATLRQWYDESCGLRFINGVARGTTNAPQDSVFTNLIPQGAEDDWDDDDDDERDDL